MTLHAEGTAPSAGEKPPTRISASFQDDLTDKPGARVTVQHGVNGKGKLIVAYNSLDELDGILSHIQ